MFFIDKYANLTSEITTQEKVLTKILNSFNNHN